MQSDTRTRPHLTRHDARRNTLSWFSRTAVRQSRIAKAMGEPAVSRAFLAVAQTCAVENLNDPTRDWTAAELTEVLG